MLDQLLEHGPVRERRASGQHVEHGAAQRIQVAAHVHVAGVARLLGADVVERAEGHAALGQAVVAAALESAGEAHVDELRPPLGRHDDVRRLDVAMDDPPLRGVDERPGDLEGVINRLADRHAAVLLDPLADRRPLNVLERNEVVALVVADGVDARDVLVVEPGGGAAFLVEPLHDLGVARLLGGQDLQRDDGRAAYPARGRRLPCRRRRSTAPARTCRSGHRAAATRARAGRADPGAATTRTTRGGPRSGVQTAPIRPKWVRGLATGSWRTTAQRVGALRVRASTFGSRDGLSPSAAHPCNTCAARGTR